MKSRYILSTAFSVLDEDILFVSRVDLRDLCFQCMGVRMERADPRSLLVARVHCTETQHSALLPSSSPFHCFSAQKKEWEWRGRSIALRSMSHDPGFVLSPRWPVLPSPCLGRPKRRNSKPSSRTYGASGLQHFWDFLDELIRRVG